MKKANRATVLVLTLFLAMIILPSLVIMAPAPLVATVQLDRMDVLYIGVENPVTVTVPGADPAEVRPSITGGSMVTAGTAGAYFVYVSSGTNAKITVSVKHEGSMHVLDTFEYRIKRLPDPVAFVNNIKHEGVMPKEDLPTLTRVAVRMENFDFDVTFTVQMFSLSVIEDGQWKEYKAPGPALTDEMKAAIGKCEQNDKILFHGIVVTAPDGTLRKLSTVTITVQ
jgi:hypothetical protein